MSVNIIEYATEVTFRNIGGRAHLSFIKDNVWYLDIIRVNSCASRNGGIGSMLLSSIVEYVKSKGIILYAEVSSTGDMSNEELLSWYLRRGFAVVAEEEAVAAITEVISDVTCIKIC